MGAFMMVTALAWPLIGGAVVGLVIGLIRGHGLIGTILDIIAGGIVGYALTIGVMISPLAPTLAKLHDSASLALSLGLPVLGGLIGVWLKGRVTS